MCITQKQCLFMGSIYTHVATHKQATFKEKGKNMDLRYFEIVGRLLNLHPLTASEVLLDEDKDTHLVLHITGLDDEDPKKGQ